jgi:hypothetical protein
MYVRQEVFTTSIVRMRIVIRPAHVQPAPSRGAPTVLSAWLALQKKTTRKGSSVFGSNLGAVA